MPSKFGINGKVVTTKPLNYLGNLISQFTLTFKKGKAVKYSAKDHLPTLKSLITYDEGSCYAGEIAIVEHYSPISLSGVLFYETLFDENASCHIALGRAYAMNLIGGTKMSKEELVKNGANQSGTHVDFMFGSKDMNIDGITKTGEIVNIYKNGKFVFKH
jgi:aminopeptidase